MRSRSNSPYSRQEVGANLFVDDRKQRKSISSSTYLILILVAIVGGGAYFYHSQPDYMNESTQQATAAMKLAQEKASLAMKAAMDKASKNMGNLKTGVRNSVNSAKNSVQSAYKKAADAGYVKPIPLKTSAPIRPAQAKQSVGEIMDEIVNKDRNKPQPENKKSLTEKLDQVLVQKVKHDAISATTLEDDIVLDRNKQILEALRIMEEREVRQGKTPTSKRGTRIKRNQD